MNIFYEGDIVPGERIGVFHLGGAWEQLEKYVNQVEYKYTERTECFVIEVETMMFWVHKETRLITQILVYGGFKGKFNGLIGIGSTLSDVKQHVGDWYEDLNVYVLADYPGICFELVDEEDWDQLKSPIEYISVYDPKTFGC